MPAESNEVPNSPNAEEGEDGAAVEVAANGDAADKKERKGKRNKEPKPPPIIKDKGMGALKHEELDWIWIGDAEDARDHAALRKNNVRYIMNCTPLRSNGGVANFHERDPNFDYCRLAMGDNATEDLTSRFEIAWAFFEKARIREDGGVLVHCQQGVSRSVSMVLSYLMKYYRMNFNDALALAKTARSQANPNEGFSAQLRELDETLRKSNSYEKVEPRRKRPTSQGPAGRPEKARNIGVARGPAGPVAPARGPTGPAVGPPRGPAVGPAVGPSIGPSAGPSVGPAAGPQKPGIGPALGPAAGPAMSPAPGPAASSASAPTDRKAKVGPAAGPAVGPTIGPSKPKRAKSVDLT